MKILLTGCCKNIENNIDVVKKSFYELSKNIEKCKCVFYENNSEDNTPILLKKWQDEDSNVKCIIEKYTNEELLNMCKAVTWDNKPCRVEIISMARNKILNEIENDLYNEFDYVIMFDLDHKNVLPVDKILNVLNKNIDFDALICKGTDQNGDMYDTYAYRDYKYPLGAEIVGDDTGYFDILKQIEVRNKTNLIPVLSSFNGMAILKKSSIKNIRYSAYPSSALNKIYKNIKENPSSFEKYKKETLLLENQLTIKYNLRLTKSLLEIYSILDKDKSEIKTHNEGRLQGVYLYGTDGIFYQNCSGFNYPIVCEHVIFFLEMREKGFDKIFLCPELEWSSVWYDINKK